jgi:hypothetical protein
MTTIIEMAREAGIRDVACDGTRGCLERFAALVSAAEREACAKIAETPVGEYEVVVACGTEPAPYLIPRYLNWQDIVKAIRARVDK